MTRKAAVAIVTALFGALAAFVAAAQTPGAFSDNTVLTAAALNAAFAAKQDVLSTPPASTVKGSIAGGSITDLTATQLTTLCNVFTSALSGCVPASGGGTANFLRADGTWSTPPYTAPAAPPRGYLAGLTLAATGGSQAFAIAAGEATSDDATTRMILSSALAKTLGSTWTVGSGNGCLDTGAVTSGTWYDVFGIERTDTGVVDVLCSLSVSTPSLPASYTKQRRIGSIRTDGSGNIVAFIQNGDEFIWITSALDLNASTVTTASRSLYTLTVPPGVKVNALFRAQINNATSGGAVMFTSPDENDQVATAAADLGMVQVNSLWAAGRFNVRTSTSAQIGARAQQSSTTINLLTYGWIDTRGRFN